MNDLRLLKPENFPDKKNWSDLDWVNEFFEFLTGECPASITIRRGYQPKLSKKKAATIIWYLQEHLPVLPDKIDQCSFCEDLYNSHSSGHYSDKTLKHYCSSCDTYIQDGHNDEQ